MSNKISHLLKRAFKPKQLIVRQNGNMSILNLPTTFQLIFLMTSLVAICWVTVSSYGYISQKKQLSALDSQRLNDQSHWQQQRHELELKLTEQQQVLQELLNKQSVLEGLVDALPESVTPNEVNNASKNGVNDFNAESKTLTDKQSALLDHLSNKISMRTEQLHTHLKEIGLENRLSKSQTAQGGPYHQIDTQSISSDSLTVIDKLVELNELEQMITLLPDGMPVKQGKYYVSSQFGYRKDPITGRRAFHKGVDLAGWHKTDISAPAAGIVTRAGKNGGYGKFIEIKHANGLVTRFGHLHTIKVKKGQEVKKSDVIALMGSTGRSTSTHLHYEVLQNGKHINPIKLAKVLSRVQ